MREYKFKVIERKDGEIRGVEFFSPAGRCIISIVKPKERKKALQMMMTISSDLDENERELVLRITQAIFGNADDDNVCFLNYDDEKRLFFDVLKLKYPKAKPQAKHKRK